MDWDGYIEAHNDVTLYNYQLTRRDRVLLASALSYIWDSENWYTGDYDVIQAKLSELQLRIAEDTALGQVYHEAQIVLATDEASIELTDLDSLPDGDLIVHLKMRCDDDWPPDLLFQINGEVGSNYSFHSHRSSGGVNYVAAGSGSQVTLPYMVTRDDASPNRHSDVELVFNHHHDTLSHQNYNWVGTNHADFHSGSGGHGFVGPITSLKFFTSAYKFKIGTTVDVYTRRLNL